MGSPSLPLDRQSGHQGEGHSHCVGFNIASVQTKTQVQVLLNRGTVFQPVSTSKSKTQSKTHHKPSHSIPYRVQQSLVDVVVKRPPSCVLISKPLFHDDSATAQLFQAHIPLLRLGSDVCDIIKRKTPPRTNQPGCV